MTPRILVLRPPGAGLPESRPRTGRRPLMQRLRLARERRGGMYLTAADVRWILGRLP